MHGWRVTAAVDSPSEINCLSRHTTATGHFDGRLLQCKKDIIHCFNYITKLLLLWIFDQSANLAPPGLLVVLPVPNKGFQLYAQVLAAEDLLSQDGKLVVAALGAVPPQPIHRAGWPCALHDEAGCVGISDGVVWYVACVWTWLMNGRPL
jgi:hypothetical protein